MKRPSRRSCTRRSSCRAEGGVLAGGPAGDVFRWSCRRRWRVCRRRLPRRRLSEVYLPDLQDCWICTGRPSGRSIGNVLPGGPTSHVLPGGSVGSSFMAGLQVTSFLAELHKTSFGRRSFRRHEGWRSCRGRAHRRAGDVFPAKLHQNGHNSGAKRDVISDNAAKALPGKNPKGSLVTSAGTVTPGGLVTSADLVTYANTVTSTGLVASAGLVTSPGLVW